VSEVDKPETTTEEEPPFYGIVVHIVDDGFSFDIPQDLNPVTLAGIAWYLSEMAGVGMRQLMMMQAQAESQANVKKIVPIAAMPRDHLTRGGKRPD
jgi:hypothetical protein